MKITLKFFARLREVVGTNSLTYDLPAEATLAQLTAQLETDYPSLTPHLPRTIMAVNREFADSETTLQEGDEVAFFPPVSGGTTNHD